MEDLHRQGVRQTTWRHSLSGSVDTFGKTALYWIVSESSTDVVSVDRLDQFSMGDILNQLGQLFVQTIPTVVFVGVLLFALDRLLFRPMTRVLKQRQEETVGALARAREQAAETETKAREYEAAFQAARQEVYRQREADRHAVLAEREAALKRARAESESLLTQAQAELAAQVEAARKELQASGQALASQIAESILGNGNPGGLEGSRLS